MINNCLLCVVNKGNLHRVYMLIYVAVYPAGQVVDRASRKKQVERPKVMNKTPGISMLCT